MEYVKSIFRGHSLLTSVCELKVKHQHQSAENADNKLFLFIEHQGLSLSVNLS
jgi:peroxiredoxin